MRDEIILKNEMRPTFIIFSILGLISSTTYFFYSMQIIQRQATAEDLFPVISSLMVIFFSGWQTFRLSNKRHYLETSNSGIMINGTIRRYIPWSNIKNIYIDDAELASIQVDPAELGDGETLIYIELHHTEDVYYDNLLHRLYARGEKQLCEQFSSLGNRVPVNTYLVTDLSQETMCMLLHKRWKKAINEMNRFA